MIQELHTASKLFKEALDRYNNACTTFSKHYDPGNPLNRFSRSLADGIGNELQLARSYKLKVVQAEVLIRQIGNSTSSLSPISVLPSDLLLYIFQLVLRSQPCVVGDDGGSSDFLDHPKVLSHVCSNWRQIALSVPSFWSHIDLSLDSPGLLTRAKCFEARAKDSLLDLHIGFQTHHIKSKHSEADVIDYCTLITPRMRSLQLSCRNDSAGKLLSILRGCFANCTLGTLTKLKIWANFIDNRAVLFEATGYPSHPQSWALNLPRFEYPMLGVTTLQLYGAYPYWTSRAYHGLIELHLHGAKTDVKIPESQLMHILTSSPQLRIFGFSLPITTHLPDDNLPPPVSLEFLEVLDLSRMPYDRRQTLLRWIAPGSNPLHVSLGFFGGTTEPLFGDVFTRFNARSNISQLDLKGDHCSLLLPQLLLSLPKIRVLGLCKFRLLGTIKETLDANGQLAHQLPTLDAMHITRCDMLEKELRQITKIHSVNTITISGGWLYKSEGGAFTITKAQFEKHLSGITPVAKFIALD